MPNIAKKNGNADKMPIRLLYGDIKKITELTGFHRDTIRRVVRGEYYNAQIIAAAHALMEKRELEGEAIRQRVLNENYSLK